MGEKNDDIAPGTRYDDNFACPGCDEYGTFQVIEEEVNMIDETNDEEFMELLHIPVRQILPNGKLQVRVWREPHPMGDDHRITTIALHDEYGDVVEEKFLDEHDEASAEFDIDDLDEYEIRIRCSLHGTWGMKIGN